VEEQGKFLEGGDDRGKSDEISRPTDGEPGGKTKIRPVFEPEVEELEDEPGRNRDEGRKKEFRDGCKKNGSSAPSMIQAAEGQDERPPGEAVEPSSHERQADGQERRRPRQQHDADVQVQPDDPSFQ